MFLEGFITMHDFSDIGGRTYWRVLVGWLSMGYKVG